MVQQALGIGHLGLILAALGGIDAYLSFGRIQLLAGHGFLARQLAVALQVRRGVVQQRLGLRQFALGPRQRGQIGAGVDFRQQLALDDGLALGVVQLQQFAVDLGAQGHLRQWRDGAQRMQIALQRADARRGDADGNGDLPVVGWRRSGGAFIARQPDSPADQQGQQQGGGYRDQALARGGKARKGAQRHRSCQARVLRTAVILY
ncbi:hypothetical protein D3C85_122360 [compost metagenome]